MIARYLNRKQEEQLKEKKSNECLSFNSGVCIFDYGLIESMYDINSKCK